MKAGKCTLKWEFNCYFEFRIKIMFRLRTILNFRVPNCLLSLKMAKSLLKREIRHFEGCTIPKSLTKLIAVSISIISPKILRKGLFILPNISPWLVELHFLKNYLNLTGIFSDNSLRYFYNSLIDYSLLMIWW